MKRSEELKNSLDEAKKLGYWVCRFYEYTHDVKYVFLEEFKKGYELKSVDYPSDDKDKSFRNPRATFKYNNKLEADFKNKIARAEAQEKYSEFLKIMSEEERILFINQDE